MTEQSQAAVAAQQLQRNVDLMTEVAQELKNPRLPMATVSAWSVRLLAEAARESLDVIQSLEGEKT